MEIHLVNECALSHPNHAYPPGIQYITQKKTNSTGHAPSLQGIQTQMRIPQNPQFSKKTHHVLLRHLVLLSNFQIISTTNAKNSSITTTIAKK